MQAKQQFLNNITSSQLILSLIVDNIVCFSVLPMENAPERRQNICDLREQHYSNHLSKWYYYTFHKQSLLSFLNEWICLNGSFEWMIHWIPPLTSSFSVIYLTGLNL